MNKLEEFMSSLIYANLLTTSDFWDAVKTKQNNTKKKTQVAHQVGFLDKTENRKH